MECERPHHLREIEQREGENAGAQGGARPDRQGLIQSIRNLESLSAAAEREAASPARAIIVQPADGDSVDVLLKNSDTAMYHAKEQGRNNFQYYSNAMNAEANERLLLESEVRHATEREEFVVYYQPQVSLETGEIIAAEALIRSASKLHST